MEAATLLVKAGADVNARNSKRSITPIMIAGAVGHFRLLEVMASHPTADVNVQVYYINMDNCLCVCVDIRSLCKGACVL